MNKFNFDVVKINNNDLQIYYNPLIPPPPPFPLREKIGQLSKKKRSLCWSIFLLVYAEMPHMLCLEIPPPNSVFPKLTFLNNPSSSILEYYYTVYTGKLKSI